MDQRRASAISGIVRTVVARVAVGIPPNTAMGVSITQVRLSDDLQYADVFVSAISGVEAAVKHLQSHLRDIKKELGRQLTTYTVPMLRFRTDTRGEELQKLDTLLSSL
jgi:ribosome-binding factor A